MKVFIVVQGERSESSSIKLVTRDAAAAVMCVRKQAEIFDFKIPERLQTDCHYWEENHVDYIVIREFDV